jgi:hypothetical protein
MATSISSPVLHMQHSRPQTAFRGIIHLLYRFTVFVDATRQNQRHAIALFLFPLRGLLQSQPPFCSNIFSHVSDRRHRCFCSSRKIDAIRLRSNEWANTARHGCHRRARLQRCLGCDRGRAHGRWDVDGCKPTARLRKRKVYVE